MLREYQHYVMAYRLRQLLGGRVAPPGELLSIGDYAEARIERQTLARVMITREATPDTMRRLDRLTALLMFGFWHNPSEVADFLRAAIRQGSHPALGEPQAFGALFTPGERARLGEAGVSQVTRHYLACLMLAAPGIDPGALQSIFTVIEANEPPIFIDELQRAGLA